MADSITVPLLDLKAQYAPLKCEITAAVTEVIESQWFIMGPNVADLENQVADYCSAEHAVGCASGTDAILLALMAIGVEPGDEVICPSYTFFATAGSIHRLGAKPVFVDIDPVTYNMDPNLVREAASRCEKLKAIMPVDLFGQVADMDAMLELGRELNVPVIEDAAQAIGAEDVTGARAGSKALIGCFSFFPSKNLGAFGDGGVCTTNDSQLSELLGILRVHGSKPKYYHRIVGLNSRLDALQAAVLKVKLKYLDAWTQGRQRNADHYSTLFHAAGAETSAVPMHENAGLPLRTPEPAPAGARHIYNQYVIRVPAEIRDDLRNELKDKGVGTEVYYPVPLHLQECFSHLGHQKGDLPHSEEAAEQTIALPIYAELTEAQRNHVAETIIRFVRSDAKAKAGAAG